MVNRNSTIYLYYFINVLVNTKIFIYILELLNFEIHEKNQTMVNIVKTHRRLNKILNFDGNKYLGRKFPYHLFQVNFLNIHKSHKKLP